MKRFLVATFCWYALTITTYSQTSNASLGGTVADASGAYMPGVTITALNSGTGIVNTTITNEAGAYNFPSLQTGTYTLSAELVGFQTRKYTNVTLGVSQQVRQNFTLEVGGVAQSVDVTVAADTLLSTSSASVGTVLPEYKVRDLPLRLGNVLDLIATTPGAVRAGDRQGNFAGQRTSASSVTRDGVNVQDGRYEFGAYAAVFTSPDLVEEVRVIVGPSDAETARGAGAVQMVTRSGTNTFHGSAYWTNSNSAMQANTWFNNFNRVGKNYANRNEYGVRLGGPIIKNKTFFFAFFNGQRMLTKESVVGTVLTQQARQGVFRYFPGVDNGNATSNAPTVDRDGNPVLNGVPATPQSFNIFNRDPLRPSFDSSAFGREQLARMPLPNDFGTGDGLNTAGVRFLRRTPGRDIGVGEGYEINRDQYNLRIDQNFSPREKLSVIATREKDWGFGQPAVRVWPTGFDGTTVKRPDVYTFKLVSTLSSNIVNEFTASRKRSMNWAYAAANRNDDHGREALKYIPSANGIQFRVVPIVTIPFTTIGGFGTWREGLNPQKTLSDNVSWSRGKHAFKNGVEFRFTQSNGFNDPDITPRIVMGAGANAVQGIDGSITGLSGTNQTLARNILLDLSGSVSSINQAFAMKNSKDLNFYGTPDVPNNRQILYQNEFSGFFKDDWKFRPGLTLNLGVHYEWYGPVYEKNGLAGTPVGGPEALKCGWACGPISVQLVGKNSPNPKLNTYNGRVDWNNVAPSVGLSWSLPWFGKEKTVLRAGYGVNYAGALRNFITVGGVLRTPGMFLGSVGTGVSYTPTSFTTVSSVSLPIPKPLSKALLPLPATDRTQTLETYDQITPYIQNFNIEIQRQLAKNTTLEVRYVGSKGTKLFGAVNLNYENIFNNGILQAFNQTRAGQDAPLFDQMLRGINLGNGVVGPTLSGSAALRSNSTTRTMIANGSVGALADFLNRNTTGTGQGGGLLRTNGFPENFVVLNPQFSVVNLRTNPGSSTYHSLQMQFTRRLANGFTNSTAYTWSRTLGEADGDGGATYRDPTDWHATKSLLGFHRTHAITSNGSWDLPFGPNRRLLNGGPSWLMRLVETWQFGAIFNLTSGQPLSITTGLSTITNSSTDIVPNVVRAFPKSSGKVTYLANGIQYFPDLRQIEDPSKNQVTALNSTSGSFSNKAITDAQGNLLLVNPAPGSYGTLGLTWIEGPRDFKLDLNVIKRVRIQEAKELEFRINAINVLNHPVFASPNTSINSNSFGRITATSAGTTPRQIVTSLRVTF